MAYSSCFYCYEACYSLLIIRVLCEIAFLLLLSFLVIYSKDINSLIDDSFSKEITFKIESYNYYLYHQNLDNSEFCTNYKNKYLNNDTKIISDVSFFKVNLKDFQRRINLSKIFLIIVLVLSCISVLNSICTSILYEWSISGDYEHECKFCCYKLTGCKFVAFLIFGFFYLGFFLIGVIKFNKKFFNDFMEFFKSCEIANINMKVFEEIKNYIDISVILLIIGFSIKVCINIIYLTYECYTHKKEEEAENNKTVIIDLT
jgi:hypothetical protein